ncbi:hypothetical protein [Thioalkalivibrio thiocyanodenitrificans]|uniref:hypothetical protein n=1 Tax=Thioalkalivibrio thiocyanodenitrificans TaxID=243063 RepID=UPI0003A50400|nr:hypothetical protein [Thioalkalivibrio thiocyanodenitrificans]
MIEKNEALRETLMTSDEEVCGYLNALPATEERCARCHKPGPLEGGEVCKACYGIVYADL